jgi:hypothetical protein
MRNGYEVRGAVTTILLDRKVGEHLEALVDTADIPLLDRHPYKWSVGCDSSGTPRCVKSWWIGQGGKRTCFLLHRYLLQPPAGYEVDHINHNPLDNQRCNLRVVTKAENGQNRKGAYARPGSVGIRGVYHDKRTGKWVAHVKVEGRQVKVGVFGRKEEAGLAAAAARAHVMPFSQEAALASQLPNPLVGRRAGRRRDRLGRFVSRHQGSSLIKVASSVLTGNR